MDKLQVKVDDTFSGDIVYEHREYIYSYRSEDKKVRIDKFRYL